VIREIEAAGISTMVETPSDDRLLPNEAQARELIKTAGVVSSMVDTGLPAPENERQARELAKVPEGQQLGDAEL
jgi:hypothetical protein